MFNIRSNRNIYFRLIIVPHNKLKSPSNTTCMVRIILALHLTSSQYSYVRGLLFLYPPKHYNRSYQYILGVFVIFYYYISSCVGFQIANKYLWVSSFFYYVIMGCVSWLLLLVSLFSSFAFSKIYSLLWNVCACARALVEILTRWHKRCINGLHRSKWNFSSIPAEYST